MTTERINYLLSQQLEGNITPEERLELQRTMLDQQWKQVIIGSLEARMKNGITEPQWTEKRLDEMAINVLSADKTGKVISIRPARLVISFRRIAIAASVLLILGTFSWLIWKEQAPPAKIAVVTNDPLPGHNQAILRLGNGQQIQLDSMGAGNLARQQGSDIIKTDSGQLVYQKLNEKPTGFQFNTLMTPPGGQYQLVLPDGTNVWLNAASSITYPTAFMGVSRNVTVTGEVYFEVAHNKEKPFLVTIGSAASGQEPATIEVLGTHFNINAYADETSENITLLQGAVKVTKARNSQVLIPGQMASIQPDGKIGLEKNADIDQVMAWKNGYFQFESQNVASIMRQISRWYDVEVEYEGTPSNFKFTGIIGRNRSIRQVLKILDEAKIKFRIEGKKIIITS